jgi:UDP-glucose 4-epimerase
LFEVEKFDYVYHFAAFPAEGASDFLKNLNYQNNIIVSANIINECVNHDIKKLIFTSSMAVYGHLGAPYVESITPCPCDSYGIAKYAIEMDLKETKGHFGLDYTIVRGHNIQGPKVSLKNFKRNVLAIWIKQLINGKPLSIFGDGSQTRAFSHVKYYMEPFEKLLTTNLDIINIGADKPYTINEAVDLVIKVGNKYGYKGFKTFLEARREVKHAFCNHDLAKSKLNFIDNTNLEELIEEMLLWIREQPIKTERVFNYEITKNLYSYWK